MCVRVRERERERPMQSSSADIFFTSFGCGRTGYDDIIEFSGMACCPDSPALIINRKASTVVSASSALDFRRKH